MSHLGRRLMELRGEHSLSEVEKAIGLEKNQIRRFEVGDFAPSPRTLEKLAQYYHVTYLSLRKLYYADLFTEPREREAALAWAKEELAKESPTPGS